MSPIDTYRRMMRHAAELGAIRCQRDARARGWTRLAWLSMALAMAAVVAVVVMALR